MDEPAPSTNDDDPSSRLPPTAAVTVAAAPHPQTLTLALPIQHPSAAAAAGESWSDGAISTLIEAWGARYLSLSRGILRPNDWQDVAAAVTARHQHTKSDAQCKTRIESLKKKYKVEKSKPSSSWRFFADLDKFIGIKAAAGDPPPTPGKDGVRELAGAIARLGEAYERVERGKARQAMEMERQRMGFVRELELQRMDFFVKTQLELTKLNRLSSSGENRRRRMKRKQGGAAENGMESEPCDL